MAVAYPSTLPQSPLIRGFSDTRQTGTIRSEQDTGAPKTRQRFTATIRKIKFPTILNGTQRATFDTFFITTISNGSIKFTITDPVDDVSLDVRFLNPPTWSIISVSGTSIASRQWKAVYDLEEVL